MKKFSLTPLIIILVTGLMFANIETVSAQLAKPEIAVSPQINSEPPTQQFEVNITITDATVENTGNGVYGWEVDMTFDKSVLQVVNITEGPFLRNFWPPEITNTTFNSRIYNDVGLVVATCLYQPYPDFGAIVYGTDILANITFRVIAQGRTSLHFLDAPPPPYTMINTYDPVTHEVSEIPHTVKDGFFQYPFLFNVGKAYGSHGPNYHYPGEPPSPNWNPDCDFNKDNKVDISDLSYLSNNYG